VHLGRCQEAGLGFELVDHRLTEIAAPSTGSTSSERNPEKLAVDSRAAAA